MYFLKKLIEPFLSPFSVSVSLLSLGVLLLWLAPKRRFPRILVTIATFGLLLLSNGAILNPVVSRLERMYPPFDTRDADAGIRWIVVFGGGGIMNPRLPVTSRMSPTSQARLLEGIRILNAIPEARLLLSGAPDAEIGREVALVLGVHPDRIVLENKSPDTEAQAINIKRIVTNDRFVLVTSAIHMPRSMLLFARQGLTPIPAPADFYLRDVSVPGKSSPIPGVLPNSTGGPKADALFHELFGILWAKLRGTI